MIRMAGGVPYVDVGITFTGLRPGEKLNEELFHISEQMIQTPCPGILISSPKVTGFASLKRSMDRLEEMVFSQNLEDALESIRSLVPEYTPAGRS